MILGINELQRLIKEINLVENLSERELNNPEGAGLDFRIGKIFRLSGKGFLGVDDRETPKAELVAEFREGERSSYTIKPGEYVLTETVEKVNMPKNLLAIPKPRTTLHRSGVITRLGEVDPGYSGTLHPGLFNASQEDFEIELGARYVNLTFFEVKGETKPYRGQWQGGRVNTDAREKQI